MTGKSDFIHNERARLGGPGRNGVNGPNSCETEDIHTPASIQPHGLLLSLLEPDLTVVQVSQNTRSLLGVDPATLIGTPASRLLDRASLRGLREALDRASASPATPLPVTAGNLRFDGIIHRSEGLLVLELEPPDPFEQRRSASFDRILAVIARLQSACSVAALCQLAAEEIRQLTGFDRTMVYRFHEDGHGEVIAESRMADMEPYLHLHYPASDIPPQARRLYVANRSRLIVDVEYRPAPLLPAENPLTGRPNDLTFSVLRSVSPTHIQYLQNMGVRASMSISLICEGGLWGLIACHHRRPIHVSYRRRMACELLGQVLAWQLVTMVEGERTEGRLRASAICSWLIDIMSVERDILASLSSRASTVAELVDAGGVAICDEDKWTRVGQTPSVADLNELSAWLLARSDSGVYATTSLGKERPDFERLKDIASGVMAIVITAVPCSAILWFRPEVLTTVTWAGDPNKAVQPTADGQRLEPRASFAAWKELVRCQSAPWQTWEFEVANALRRAIVGLMLSRTAELARLNKELHDAVRIRDDFLSIASHELRTPIFTLALQIDGLSRAAGRRRDTFTPERAIPRLEVARRQVRRLEQLVGELLDISRIRDGGLTLDLEDVSLAKLLDEVISRFGDDLAAAGCALTVRLVEDIVGRWDRMRFDQVMTNLLANAIKYGTGKPIEIDAARIGDLARIAVTDHGIGIEEASQQRIFERFERAVSAEHYGGFGLGLWIVRHIVERLGGRVHVTSQVGMGSTFVVELPIAGPGDGEARSPSPLPGGP